MNMRNKSLMRLFLILMLALPLLAQQVDSPDDIVSVARKYVSSEGLAHQQAKTSWGREIGLATREGLNAVVDTAEKFGATRVGTFVMVMIAWKIMARQVLGIVLGIPIMIVGTWLWMWMLRRLFFGYRVLDKKEGSTKFYKDHPAYEFHSGEARNAAGVFAGGAMIAFASTMLCVIFM